MKSSLPVDYTEIIVICVISQFALGYNPKKGIMLSEK